VYSKYVDLVLWEVLWGGVFSTRGFLLAGFTKNPKKHFRKYNGPPHTVDPQPFWAFFGVRLAGEAPKRNPWGGGLSPQGKEKSKKGSFTNFSFLRAPPRGFFCFGGGGKQQKPGGGKSVPSRCKHSSAFFWHTNFSIFKQFGWSGSKVLGVFAGTPPFFFSPPPLLCPIERFALQIFFLPSRIFFFKNLPHRVFCPTPLFRGASNSWSGKGQLFTVWQVFFLSTSGGVVKRGWVVVVHFFCRFFFAPQVSGRGVVVGTNPFSGETGGEFFFFESGFFPPETEKKKRFL